MRSRSDTPELDLVLKMVGKILGPVIHPQLKPSSHIGPYSTKNLGQPHEDVKRIMGVCPLWFQNIIQIAYLSGMRKGGKIKAGSYSYGFGSSL